MTKVIDKHRYKYAGRISQSDKVATANDVFVSNTIWHLCEKHGVSPFEIIPIELTLSSNTELLHAGCPRCRNYKIIEVKLIDDILKKKGRYIIEHRHPGSNKLWIVYIDGFRTKNTIRVPVTFKDAHIFFSINKTHMEEKNAS